MNVVSTKKEELATRIELEPTKMIIYRILSPTSEEHENDTEGSASDLNKKKDLSFITDTSIANNIGP